MEKLLPELKSFIIDFCKKNKIGYIDLDSIDLDTNLEADLDIFDIDMDIFLTEFIERFNIDYSEFNWNKYGYPTGTTFLSILRMIFGYKAKWVKKIGKKLYHAKFLVGHLQEAILTGKLV